MISGSSLGSHEPDINQDQNVEGLIMSDESLCLDSPTVSDLDDESTVRYQACIEVDRQMWVYDKRSLSMIHAESKRCLTHPESGTSDILNLQLCHHQSLEQKWELISEKWKNF